MGLKLQIHAIFIFPGSPHEQRLAHAVNSLVV